MVWLASECAGASVLDFGCGYGRLAPLFLASKYLGIDINSEILKEARGNNPGYRFEETGMELPVADILLAHTVLVHVSDEDLHETLSGFNARSVVISEIMGREWRRSGHPPVYNRDEKEYIEAMSKVGYEFHHGHMFPYPHYRHYPLSVLVFRKCST